MIAPPRRPSQDEVEALIKEARERQLRRRLLGAAGVAIVSALGLSVYAFATGGSVNPVAPANAGRATGAFCRASQLSATVGWQGATQSMAGGTTLTNTSNVVCSLPTGQPILRIRWQGRTLALRERRFAPPPGKPVRILEPGAEATIFLQWWNYCGTAVTRKVPPTVYLRFPDGLAVSALATQQWGVPFCNAPGAPSTIYVSGPRTTD
jgi:Protein of unknown function (DUF4232)